MVTKEFKYCENPDAEVPRMFIDKEIGGGEGNIDGSIFLKELMYLSDVLGKSKIEVWINSPGGVVTDGMSIYTAILESKANVDTICYGLAASIAGVIFQAGKKRVMLDFSHLMYHPAFSEDGKQDKGLEALNNSICTMISKRTGDNEADVWSIMNKGRLDDKGTWMPSAEAKEKNYCDEVRNSADKNKIDFSSAKSLVTSANKVYNRIKNTTIKNTTIKNKITMEKVLNKLGLQSEASEASAVVAIDVLNKSMDDLKKQKSDLQKKLDDCNDELKKMKEDKAKADEEMKAKADEDAKNAKKADEEMKAKAADEDVKNAVKAGKIKNDATVIASFTAMYKANPVETKNLIESLSVTKTAPIFVSIDTDGIKDSEAETVARKNGLKPGTAGWYNAIKEYTLKAK